MEDKSNKVAGLEESRASALHGIEMYMRLAAQSQLEEQLSGIFESAKEMRIYELSDGVRSTRELAELTSDNKNRVSDLWKKWGELGIAVSSGPLKPYVAKFSLVELALNQGDKRERKID